MAEYEVDVTKKKRKKELTNSSIRFLLLSTCLIVLLGTVLFWHYNHLFRGREILRSAKLVRLVIKSDSYDYYSQGKSIIDNSRKNHLAKDAEAGMLKRAEVKGTIQYVDFNEKQMEVTEMIYIEDEYAVRFCLKKNEPVWTVYRMDEILNY